MDTYMAVFYLFLALVAAAPAPNWTPGPYPSPKCSVSTANANFDDVTPMPGVSLTPPPTPYRGLYYQSFFVSQPTTNLSLPGIIPHSPPNYAYTSPVTQTLGGTAMLTVNYPNSKVVSFSPKSLYFACDDASPEAVTGIPGECLINLTGYTGNDNTVADTRQVCSQQLHYLPSTQLGRQQMAFSGTLKPCFKDIAYLVVTYSLPGGTSLLQATSLLRFDDVVYDYTTCQ